MPVTTAERPATAAPANTDAAPEGGTLPEGAAHEEHADAAALETLRERAHTIAESLPTGYRVEVFGGAVVVSPTPSKRHGAIVTKVMLALAPQLPDGQGCFQMFAVGLPGQAGEFAIPDLVVGPDVGEDDDGWLVAPEDVPLVVEVVSPRNADMDLSVKFELYAGFAIPIYLVIDPRQGEATSYSAPRNGRYQAHHTYEFGDEMRLPEPLEEVVIATENFLRYK